MNFLDLQNKLNSIFLDDPSFNIICWKIDDVDTIDIMNIYTKSMVSIIDKPSGISVREYLDDCITEHSLINSEKIVIDLVSTWIINSWI